MADGKCEVCRENKAAQHKWHGMVLCSQCVTVAGQIKKRKSAVHELYRKICGTELADSAGVDAAPGENTIYRELLAEIANALPGALSWEEIPERIAELVASAQGVQGVKCDPHTCEELAGAIKELLAVRQALGDYAPENEDPGALAGGVYLAVKAAREPTVQLDKYEGMLTEIALALDGGTGTCEWSTMPDEVRRLVDNDCYTVPDGYESLFNVFVNAMRQAAEGKGKARHANGQPFERQPTCLDARELGIGFPVGQARKKALEAVRLEGMHRVHELLGAINYLGIAVVVERERLEELEAEVAPGLPVEYAEGVGHD